MILIKRESASHWYLPDRTPFHEVERADGKGLRPVTLRDARKVRAYPSVTNILGVLAKPALDAYRDGRVRFVPEGREDPELDPDSDDEIPYSGVAIDLGEAAAEQLALMLDPYPRKPGADLPAAADDSQTSPFAALARLKRPS